MKAVVAHAVDDFSVVNVDLDKPKTGEVLAERGGVIKGLYAAGRSAVGVASHSYVSGLSIAGCIFSGRRAGRHAGGKQR